MDDARLENLLVTAGRGRLRRVSSLLLVLLWLLTPAWAHAARPVIQLESNEQGARLVVDGKPFLVKGVVWGYSPIGTNYAYSLWKQPRSLIERVLADQMPLLQAAGVNAIRPFDVPPPEWVQYIYEKYGIFTSVNDMLGRYGFTRDGVWQPHTDYADPETRRFLLGELEKTVLRYRSTPGILFWLIGNENNYGLSWTGAATENFPGERERKKAAALYSLMSEAAQLVKRLDASRPVAMVNGDLNYLDIIAKFKAGFDVFGTNQYRGRTVGKLFVDVREKLGLPVVFTEFGADCFNDYTGQEDTLNQARFLKAQWREVYEQSYGNSGTGNALGGFMFEWTDTWWKVGQSYNLSVHDTLGTWSHPPYYDYVEGENNMQEEWWGITALTPSDATGFYSPEPRTAYYMVADIFRIDPFAEGQTRDNLRAQFAAIRPESYQATYLARTASERAPLRLQNLRLNLEMTASRGSSRTARGSTLAVDHTESAYVDAVLSPSSKLYARLSLNFVANAAQNRLDPIYYENPTSYTAGAAPNAPRATAPRPVDIYQAEVKAEHRWFNLEAFYRVGHAGWDYEGDLFHLYPAAYYQEAVDMYRSPAPFGGVISGRRAFDGLKLALGPQLYWGANPALIAKYTRPIGPFGITAMYQEDLAQASATAFASSSVTPVPLSRKAMLGVSTDIGETQIQIGGLFSSPQRVGDEYTRVEETSGPGYAGSGYDVRHDEIRWRDTLGGKAKVTSTIGRFAVYAQGAAKGLVADGGPDTSTTITGWTLKESGRGNQVSGLAGVAIALGALQVAPNGLYQRPFVGPNPRIGGAFDPATDTFLEPVRARTTFVGSTPHEPFAVLDNRETVAGELLLTYDPTPATAFYQWDRDSREDAPFAASLDFVYRHQPTSRDSNVGVLGNGERFAFGAAPPAHDVWGTTFNFVASGSLPVRLSGALYFGQDQSRGLDPRLVTHYGGSLRVAYWDFALATRLLFNDWGPYDYYRDYNLTYPLQWYGDASWGLRPVSIGELQTRFGVRTEYRSLDQHSDGWADPLRPGRRGYELEVTSYLQVSL